MTSQIIKLQGDAGGKRFDGIGIVDGGGATSVLLKDYPEPQRSQILDLVFKPKFGASVSALFVEIPGDGNSTQGSMSSHRHTRDDLNYSRGYTWWMLREAKKRDPKITLDGTAWSAPGWLGNGEFWSQDTANYYLSWLWGLREVHGLEFEAIGCRNEKGVSFEFVKMLRKTLNGGGFENVKIHAFDNWGDWKLDFVQELLQDEEARDAIDIIGAHTLNSKYDKGIPASPEVQQLAAQLGKPIWNTEDHVYLKGFDCAISIVECFNDNFISSGATKIVNWYDIAALYPIEPYPEEPAMLLAYWPWCGHYQIRESLWGYAHYGQFCEVGWHYLSGACGELAGGGTFVTLVAPNGDYSVILETKLADAPQPIRLQVRGGLATGELCVWKSDAREQFVQQADINPQNGVFALELEPNSIYSLTTTSGQQKGAFENIPAPAPFPFPYYEDFESYNAPAKWGYLPRYSADIAGAFELAARPDGDGICLRQVVPIPTISWAPDWLPYTILGDENWTDYEVSADVYLGAGEIAGVMGRVNHVGTGFGFVPQCYLFQMSADGECRLSVIRGKEDKQKLVGDAEQQAQIKALNDADEGGEKELATVQIANVGAGQWHNLKLRFEDSTITASLDGKPVLSANDAYYGRGMVGLLAGKVGEKLSQPYFDNLLIQALDAPTPAPSAAMPGQQPIYD